jgi:hypothetical protein
MHSNHVFNSVVERIFASDLRRPRKVVDLLVPGQVSVHLTLDGSSVPHNSPVVVASACLSESIVFKHDFKYSNVTVHTFEIIPSVVRTTWAFLQTSSIGSEVEKPALNNAIDCRCLLVYQIHFVLFIKQTKHRALLKKLRPICTVVSLGF